MRKTLLVSALIGLLAGAAGSHADDGVRFVALTASRVTTALGFTPVNPGAANTFVSGQSIAGNGSGVNLAIGSAATSFVSTATPDSITTGSSVSNTAGSNPKFQTYPGFGLGISSGEQDYIAAAGSTHAFFVGGSMVMKATSNGVLLPKLSAAPASAPGGSAGQIFLVQDGTGTCKLGVQAGTSTSPIYFATAVGAGC